MGNKASATVPTAQDFAALHVADDPPLGSSSRTNDDKDSWTFRLPGNAWTAGCIIPELNIRVVPDDTAKFYQGSKCYIYQTLDDDEYDNEEVLVAILLSYDSLRVRICTTVPPFTTSLPLKDMDHQGQALYEYAFVTKKRDSTQHILHMRALGSGSAKPRLVTRKFTQDGRRHRAIQVWNTDAAATNNNVWAAIYDVGYFFLNNKKFQQWQVRTAAGVDSVLVLAYTLSTDRFVHYVDQQHLRRTVTLSKVIDF